MQWNLNENVFIIICIKVSVQWKLFRQLDPILISYVWYLMFPKMSIDFDA